MIILFPGPYFYIFLIGDSNSFIDRNRISMIIDIDDISFMLIIISKMIELLYSR